jgi:hypothetical protein
MVLVTNRQTIRAQIFIRALPHPKQPDMGVGGSGAFDSMITVQ